MEEFVLIKNILFILVSFIISASSFALVASKRNQVRHLELNIGQLNEPSGWDPQKCRDSPCSLFVYQLFEGLVVSNGEGKILPASAERWKLSSDGKTYTFYLRKNIKWSDGSKLTAFDFEYSMRRLVDPHVFSEQSYITEFIKNSKDIIKGKKPITSLGVKAIDEETLEISLTQPTPVFLEILAISSNFPVQQKNIEKYGNLFTLPENLVSNGSYKLKSFEPGEKITLIRNLNYWNDKETNIDKVNYYKFSDPNMLFRLYQTGHLDMVSDIHMDQFQGIKAKFGSELKSVPVLGCYFYSLNTSKPPFNNKKLRQALSIAVDRDTLSQVALSMSQIPLYDFVPYGLKNHDHTMPYWQKWPRDRQIAEAKKLYKEAGYSENNKLNTLIYYNKSDFHHNIAMSVAEMWKQTLGVNAVLVGDNWDKILKKARNGNFQIMRMGVLANINDVYDFYNILTSTNPLNDSKYKNQKYDLLVKDLMEELDPKKRKELIKKASQILLEDMPKIPIFSKETYFLLKPYIQDFKMNSLQLYLLSEMRFEGRSKSK
jgi:oligopeptide transport system substrate-binding protein